MVLILDRESRSEVVRSLLDYWVRHFLSLLGGRVTTLFIIVQFKNDAVLLGQKHGMRILL